MSNQCMKTALYCNLTLWIVFQTCVITHCVKAALTIKGHVFDETHLQRLLLCQRHKIKQLILIEASHDHTVNLPRAAHNKKPLITKLYIHLLSCVSTLRMPISRPKPHSSWTLKQPHRHLIK